MTPAELQTLPDVTPQFGSVEQILDGRRVIVPILSGGAAVLFQKEDDGVFEDAAGVYWLTGWADGRRVRRKVT